MTTRGRPSARPVPGRPAGPGAGLPTTALVALLIGVLAGLLGACSSGSDEQPRSAEPSASATAPAVPTEVRYGAVTGRLPQAERHRLADRVRRVVDGWTAAAYLDGPYPRRDFGAAFPGFTSGARDDARRDRALMSNQDVGGRIDGVVPRRSRLVLDVLAVRKRPVGVTAHVDLRFATSGRVERAVRVAGRVYLTPTSGGWKIFGYDISKGAV